MVDRQEVEAILAEVHSMAEINQVAVGDIAHPVSGDTLADLCRAWLAVDGAPVALMGMDCVLYGNPSPLVALNGQRVRIVPVEGDQ